MEVRETETSTIIVIMEILIVEIPVSTTMVAITIIIDLIIKILISTTILTLVTSIIIIIIFKIIQWEMVHRDNNIIKEVEIVIHLVDSKTIIKIIIITMIIIVMASFNEIVLVIILAGVVEEMPVEWVTGMDALEIINKVDVGTMGDDMPIPNNKIFRGEMAIEEEEWTIMEANHCKCNNPLG